MCYFMKWKNLLHFISYSCLWAYKLVQTRETKIRLHHWAQIDFVMKVRECTKLRHKLIQNKKKTNKCITNILRVAKPHHKMFRKYFCFCFALNQQMSQFSKFTHLYHKINLSSVMQPNLSFPRAVSNLNFTL